jgi:hypothetical protein
LYKPAVLICSISACKGSFIRVYIMRMGVKNIFWRNYGKNVERGFFAF